MELHPPGLMLAVLETHDLAFGGPGHHFERGGQGLTLHQQGVIARGWKRILEAREQPTPLMNDLARLAVQDALGAHDLAAVDVAEALMSEAHAQHRHAAREALDHVVGHPGLARRLGSGRNDEPVGMLALQGVGRDLVVTIDARVAPQIAQRLHQVVGERVVVIDDGDHSGLPSAVSRPSSARSSAMSRAFPLLMVSAYSRSGTESYTMPAPTPRCARPSLSNSVRMAMARSRLPCRSK